MAAAAIIDRVVAGVGLVATSVLGLMIYFSLRFRLRTAHDPGRRRHGGDGFRIVLVTN